jgi:hypothetical protein
MREEGESGGAVFLRTVRSELDRVRGTTAPVSRKALRRAADQYARSGSKRGRRVEAVQVRLDAAMAAAAAFCRSCEPEGYCQTPDCPLRPVSPLPLAVEPIEVELAVKAPGAWGTSENRENQVAAIRAANARRWTPEERVRFAVATRRRWERLTPEERAEWGRRISAGRKGAA